MASEIPSSVANFFPTMAAPALLFRGGPLWLDAERNELSKGVWCQETRRWGRGEGFRARGGLRWTGSTEGGKGRVPKSADFRGHPLFSDPISVYTRFGSEQNYTVEEHIARNPSDSDWVSLSEEVAVALFFALSYKAPRAVGEKGGEDRLYPGDASRAA